MTEEAVTPAAPDAPAAPAAPVVAPTETTSLVDGVDPNAAPAEPSAAPTEPSLVPETPAEEAKWYLAENVPGEGEPPEWFKGDKYKTLDEQAKAYSELEKRFGAFTGAPKDGVYKINMPDGFQGEFDTEHQLFQELNSWAKESNMSQEGYDQAIGMLARYEASMLPDMGEIKAQLGENADARISSVAQWAKSNLSADEYNAFRAAQTQSNAADVFKAFEAVIGKTRQVSMPKPGDDVPGVTANGWAEIEAMRNKRNETGQRLYEVDQKYREQVEAANLAYWQGQEKQA